METLRPSQRIAAIFIGLALTALLGAVVLPRLSGLIEARLPPTRTPAPATPTREPTPTTEPSPTPAPDIVLTPPPASVSLSAVPYVPQTQGDGGAAALTMALGYWEYTDTYDTVLDALQPGELDLGVEMEELAAYARGRELATRTGVGSSTENLRRLLANEFPVIVSRWITSTEGPGSRAYAVLRGYDDEARTFLIHSPLDTSDLAGYDAFDDGWRTTCWQYLLVCPIGRQAQIDALDTATASEMWQAVLDRSEKALGANADDGIAWLNQATALAAQDRCEQALVAFDRASQVELPEGLLWHQFAYYRCLLDMEEYDRLLVVTEEAIQESTPMEQIHLYRAQALAAQGDVSQARAQYELALDIHPGWEPAQEGLRALTE